MKTDHDKRGNVIPTRTHLEGLLKSQERKAISAKLDADHQLLVQVGSHEAETATLRIRLSLLENAGGKRIIECLEAMQGIADPVLDRLEREGDLERGQAHIVNQQKRIVSLCNEIDSLNDQVRSLTRKEENKS